MRKREMSGKIFGIALVLLIIGLMFTGVVPSAGAPGDDYHVYSKFNAPGTGLVWAAGGYVEYYGVPEWGDEIQYVYFLQREGSRTIAYKVKVWVTNEGSAADPTSYIDIRQHPDHPTHTGPIEPRHFEIVSSFDITEYADNGGWASDEFHVDSAGVYLGAWPHGINKWDHDWNYIGQITNPPPSPYETQTLAYDSAGNVWYAGNYDRKILQLSDTDGDGNFMDETWRHIFTTPDYAGSHHDGMEYVGGYLWISDMTSDVIAKWQYDDSTDTWAEIGRYSYTEAAVVEGMGFGPNDHFWIGGYGYAYIYELGNEITTGYPIAEAGSDVDAHPPTILVKFDASGSHHTDPAKEIVLYEWDFESDGTWDYSGTDLIVEHTYPAYYILVSARAAELAKSVIGADYQWGAKGYCWDRGTFVEPEQIIETGYGWNWSAPKEYGTCLDCSGLAFWSYNKVVGTVKYGDSILSEGAHGQWNACDKIDRADLRPGDLLFFDEYPVGDGVMNHVAVYVGPFIYEGETYNVVHASGFVNKVTHAHYNPENNMLTTVKATGEKQTIDVDGYGRVTEDPAPDSSIDWDKSAKDYTASLRVTDNSDPPLRDTDTCIVHITAPPWKPVADPNGPYEGRVGTPIQLDGSKSYDPESKMFPPDHPWYETIAKYEWDLDYDGEFDDSTDVKPSWTWDSQGIYIVGLKITDSQASGTGGTIGPLDVDIKYATVTVKKPEAFLFAPNMWFGSTEQYFATTPFFYTDDIYETSGEKSKTEYLDLSEDQKWDNFTIFYHIAETEDEKVYEYWFYYAYNNFINEHYHDWETVYVFVDKNTEEVTRVVASAHGDWIQNNEYFNPQFAEGEHPGILVEEGSHASCTDRNNNGLFEITDVTNWDAYRILFWNGEDQLNGCKLEYNDLHYTLKEINDNFILMFKGLERFPNSPELGWRVTVPIFGGDKFIPVGGKPPTHPWYQSRYYNPEEIIPILGYYVGGSIQLVDGGIPIGAIVVILSDEPYYTFANETGNFLINNVSSGVHDIVVNLDGYAPYKQRFIHYSNTTVGVDGILHLIPESEAFRIQGEVTNTAGNVIVNAIVDVYDENGIKLFTALTDENGQYLVIVSEEHVYTVTASTETEEGSVKVSGEAGSIVEADIRTTKKTGAVPVPTLSTVGMLILILFMMIVLVNEAIKKKE